MLFKVFRIIWVGASVVMTGLTVATLPAVLGGEDLQRGSRGTKTFSTIRAAPRYNWP